MARVDLYDMAAYLTIGLLILAMVIGFVALIYWAVGEAFGYLMGRYPNPWQRLALTVLVIAFLLGCRVRVSVKEG